MAEVELFEGANRQLFGDDVDSGTDDFNSTQWGTGFGSFVEHGVGFNTTLEIVEGDLSRALHVGGSSSQFDLTLPVHQTALTEPIFNQQVNLGTFPPYFDPSNAGNGLPSELGGQPFIHHEVQNYPVTWGISGPPVLTTVSLAPVEYARPVRGPPP